MSVFTLTPGHLHQYSAYEQKKGDILKSYIHKARLKTVRNFWKYRKSQLQGGYRHNSTVYRKKKKKLCGGWDDRWYPESLKEVSSWSLSLCSLVWTRTHCTSVKLLDSRFVHLSSAETLGKKEKRKKHNTVLSKIQNVVFSALDIKSTDFNMYINRRLQVFRVRLPAPLQRPRWRTPRFRTSSRADSARSQPPETLTYTRRPAARHSQPSQPITTRALPTRHRQPPYRVKQRNAVIGWRESRGPMTPHMYCTSTNGGTRWGDAGLGERDDDMFNFN